VTPAEEALAIRRIALELAHEDEPAGTMPVAILMRAKHYEDYLLNGEVK
jgi:hypothetical protein